MKMKYKERERRNNINNGFLKLKKELELLDPNKKYTYLELLKESLKYIQELKYNIKAIEYEIFSRYIEINENKIYEI